MLRNLGSKVAVSIGDLQITYTNLLGKIEYFSSLYNLNSGEHVVICSENRSGWIYAFYSIWKKRGIVIPIDFLSTVDEIAYILKDSSPSVIFVSSAKKNDIEKAVSQAGILTKIIVFNQYESIECDEYIEDDFPVPEEDEAAAILYTSGTTGMPKGVILSYGNMLANVKAVSEKIPIFTKDSRVMILLPLHHVLPLLGSLIAPMYVGGMVAISPSMTSEDIINTLGKNAITIIIGVPRLYSAIRKGIKDKINKSFVARKLFAFAKKVNSQKFSRLVFNSVHKKFGGNLKYLVSGGAALDPEVGGDFKTLGFEVLEGYGMTEAAPMLSFTRPGKVNIGSPGHAMPGVELKIKNGEIIARGPNVMKGYYKRPEDTNLVLKNGWLHTGDLGHLDSDGYLYITGRKKEIIVLSNGKNINPEELEEKLISSPLILDCGVFLKNERIQAVFVTEDVSSENHKIIKKELVEPFNKSISSYKRIMNFYLTKEQLPRTRLGKLQRFKLTEYMEEEKKDDDIISNDSSEEFDMIAGFIELEKEKIVMPFHHLEYDLGMDSLDKVGLQVYIHQNFGVDIEAQELSAFGSVEKLVDYVAKTKTKMEDEKINWHDILREKINFKLPVSWLPMSLMMRLSKFFFHIYFRFKSHGIDNLPEGGCIIAPNHQSFFDGLFVTTQLRTRQIRKTYFYAKAQHVKRPLVKFLANKNNIIVVDLNRNLKESIQKLAEVLKMGKNLIIFPEGTRSTTGKLGSFKKTFAILSRELNIPVVPVSIQGAVNALPKGSFIPRPWKKVQVEFLKPVYPGKNSYEEIALLVKESISNRINMQ